MDEIINQQTDTIQSPPIQQEKPIKNKPSIWILFTIIFFITTLILSYLLLNQKQEVDNKETKIIGEVKEELDKMVLETEVIEEKDKVTTEKSDIEFDVTKIKIGDIIEGLEVISIYPASDNVNPPLENPLPFGNDNVYIQFKGEIILDGEFSYEKEAEFMGPRELLVIKINKNNSHIFNDYIEIDNLEVAKELLSVKETDQLKTGQIKFVIDNYTMIRYPSSGLSSGKLVKIL